MEEGYTTEFYEYLKNDVAVLNEITNFIPKKYELYTVPKKYELYTGIKKVIFNGPATIVIWLDGTKTVVKCAEGDGYSKFSGLAIAICKRMYGEDFKKIFNHFIPKEETKCHSSETTN